MKRWNQRRTAAGQARLWRIVWIGLLLLSVFSCASAETGLVSVTALTVPAEVSQYSTVTLTAALAYEGTPQGTVEFAVKPQGASAYTELGRQPVASAATLSDAGSFSAVGAYTVRVRYLPASGETDHSAGTVQYQTVNVRGARSSDELATAMANGSGTRTLTLENDLTLTAAVQVNGSVTLTGGHILSRGSAEAGFTLSSGASLTVTDTVIDGKDLMSTKPLFALPSSGTLTLSEGVRVVNVKSSANGGVAYAPVGGQLQLSQTALIENCATTGKGTLYLAGGGTLTMADSARISDCAAAEGGAVYLDHATAKLSGSASVKDCKGSSAGGGIAAANTSSISLADDAAITGCTAGIGAGVSASGSTLTMKNRAAIADNTATTKGGGVLLVNTASRLSMSGSTSISGNQTTSDTAAYLGGGGVRLEAGASAAMNDTATVANNTANYDGGGFNIDDRAVLTLGENASITGNVAKNGHGGGVNVDNGATLTLTGNAAISKNSAKKNGGGIDLDGLLKNSVAPSPALTTVTLSDYAAITGNTCEERGGGIMVYKHCTLTLNGNAVISLNSAKDGGGVYVEGVDTDKASYDQSIVNLMGGTISANTATNHGGGVLLYYGTLNLQDGAITANKAGQRGGGVYVAPVCAGITMKGASMISENEAGDDGGGVCVISEDGWTRSGRLTLEDTAAILNNRAAQSGGGMYMRLGGDDNTDTFHVAMSGHSSISGNSAGKGSGGFLNDTVYKNPPLYKNVHVSYLYLSDSANVSGNETADFYVREVMYLDEAYIHITGRYTGSCGIYFPMQTARDLDSAIAYWDGYTPANDDIASYEAYCFYNNNDLDGHFETRSGWTYKDNPTTLKSTKKNVYLKQSGAKRRVTAYYSDSDAALSSYHYKAYSTSLHNAFHSSDVYTSSHKYLWVQVNSPETTGEALEARDGKVLTVTGAQITRTAGHTGSLFTVKAGGTLILDGVRLDGGSAQVGAPLVVVEGGGTLILRNGATLANNLNTSAAQAGGAISAAKDSKVLIESGAVITGNKHIYTYGTGGGVYSDGTVVMSGGSVGKNNARDGGGVYSTGSFTLSGGSVAGNTADASGGGVYVKGTGSISGGLIEQNTATGNIGGGVCVAGTGSLTLTGGQVKGNSAKTVGGGIASDADLFLQGGSINGNKAATGGGVGVQNGKTAQLNGTVLVTDNEAAGNGGGVAGGNVTLGGTSRIAHNKAGGNGGGVFADGTFAMLDSPAIDGNSASNGGGVFYRRGSGLLWCASGAIADNTATGDGGGLYIEDGGSALSMANPMGSCRITGNTAAGKGGGIYAADGLTLSISSITIAENKAKNGGGLYMGNSKVTFLENTATQTGASITSNLATEAGAGITNNGGTLAIGKATISGNTAETSGGGIHHIGGSLTLTDGTQLTSNRALTGSGGGMLLQSGAVRLENALIQKNAAQAGGGADCAFAANDSTSTLTVGASTSIDHNNSYIGSKSNLRLLHGKRVTLTDAAMTGTIGVTPDGTSFPLPITQGATATRQTVSAFSDDTDRHVTALLSGNVVLGASEPVVRVKLDGLAAVEFGSLSEAFDYVNANSDATKTAVVTLLKDAEVSAQLTLNAGRSATLSGYSIKRTAAYANAGTNQLMIENKGTLTLGAVTLEGDADKLTGTLIHNTYTGTLTLDGAVLQNGQSAYGAIMNLGILEMKSGTIKNCSSKPSAMPGSSAIQNYATLRLLGGSITGCTGDNPCILSNDLLGSQSTVLLGGTVITGNSAGVKHTGTGELLLTGKPVVAGNTAYNLYLPTGTAAKLSAALTEGARIGVTTATPPVASPDGTGDLLVATNALAPSAAFFTSDDARYAVTERDNKVFLTVGGRTIPAPGASSVTSDSVTLLAVTPSLNGAGDVIEYGLSTSTTAEPASWQTGLNFNGLTPNTTYYFKARVVQGTEYKDAVSPFSAAVITADVRTVTLTKPASGITGFTVSHDSTDGVNGTWAAYTAPVTVGYGGSLYIKAALENGYSFVQWADGVTANPYRLTNILNNVDYTPTATLQTRTVTLTKPMSGITGFSVSRDSTDGINGTWAAYTAPVTVGYGGSLYIKAALENGYSFVQWADGITANPYRLTNILNNVDYTPTATLQTRAVTLTKPASGITGFSVSHDSTDGVNGTWAAYTAPVTVGYGGSLYIKAALENGYSFVQWADGITANPYRVTNILNNVDYTPDAGLIRYLVTFDDNGATTPHSGGDSEYTILSASFTMPAAPQRITADETYIFVGWNVTTGALGGSGFQAGDLITDATRMLNGAYGAVTLTAVWDGEPVILTQPSDQTAVAGERVEFTLRASGALPLTYQWESNAGDGWKKIVQAVGSSLMVASAESSQNGLRVRCIVSNGEGSVTSREALLTVLRRPINPPASENSITGITNGQAFWQGETITFTANGGGMDNTAPLAGDTRWLPSSWSTNSSGDFKGGYTQHFATRDIGIGAHTLSVVFTQQRYDGTAWVDASPLMRHTASVIYQIKAAPVPPRTGDDRQPLLWLLMLLTGVVGLLARPRKRRT